MRTLIIGLVVWLVTGLAWGQFTGATGGGTGISGRSGRNAPLGDSSVNTFGATFITGRVVLSDGAALQEPAKIERICLGSARVSAYTDLKGRFNFDLSRSQELADASEASSVGPSRASRTPIADCELHISLPGFRTETISLSAARFADNPDLGTIILKRDPLAKTPGKNITLSLERDLKGRSFYDIRIH